MSTRREIADRIKRLMDKYDWTQSDLAKICHISQQDVHLYLKGKLNPENLVLHLHLHGENIQWLLTGKLPTTPTDNAIKVVVQESLTKQERIDLVQIINVLVSQKEGERKKALSEVFRGSVHPL